MPDFSATPYIIPATVPVTFLVICRLPDGIEPSPDALKQIVRKWIRVYVAPPLLEPVTRAFESPAFALHVEKTSALPPSMMDAVTADMPADEARRLRTTIHMIVCSANDAVLSERSGLWACVAAALACAGHYNSRWIVNTATEALLDSRIRFADLHANGIPRLRPFVRCRITTGASGEAVMATSGLSLFGLPEIALANVPPVDADNLQWLMAAIGQILAAMATDLGRSQPESPAIVFPLETVVTADYLKFAGAMPPPTTGGMARVRLDRMPGSSHLELLPPAGDDAAIWLRMALQTFFPAEHAAEPVSRFIDATPLPHPRAVETLPGIKARYLSGEFKRWQLLVKSGFAGASGDLELMWVAVEEWNGTSIIGSLVSRPQIATDLSEGQTVQLREEDIHDWTVMGPRGKQEGGFTDSGTPVEPRAVANPFASLHPPDRALLEWIQEPWFQNALAANARTWYNSRVPNLAFNNAKARWQYGLTGVSAILFGLLILHYQPASRTAAPAFPWIVGAIAFVLILKALLPRPRETRLQKVFAALASDGEPGVAYLAFTPKTRRRQDPFRETVVVLFTLDHEEGDYETLPAIVTKIRELRGKTAASEFPETAALVNAPYDVLKGRQRLPDELASGREISLAAITVSQSHLLPKIGSVSFFPIMATRGECGYVEMIPYDVLGRTYGEIR